MTSAVAPRVRGKRVDGCVFRRVGFAAGAQHCNARDAANAVSTFQPNREKKKKYARKKKNEKEKKTTRYIVTVIVTFRKNTRSRVQARISSRA